MPIPADQIVVKTITLDETKLMSALKVPRKSLLRYMTQARAITHLATHWVEQAFGVPVEGEEGAAVGAMTLKHPSLHLRATIRTFNRGKIQFQQSKRMGVHRDPMSSRADMIADVTNYDIVFACDLRRFPRVDIYPVRTAKVLNFIHGHDVGKNGITPDQFDKFIRENFDAEFQDYDHAEFRRRERRLKRLGRVPYPSVMQIRR